MEMREELKKRTGEVESIVDSYLPAEEGYQKTIFEAMNYSVRAGGKRLRPHAHGRNLSSVWRYGKSCGTLHGSHGDDPHLIAYS